MTTKGTPKKKKLIFRLALVFIMFAAIFRLAQSALSNDRVRLLLSVVHFAESTLQNPGYLAYDVDIMELCHDYANADTQITGKIGMKHVKRVNTSMSMEVDAKRSFSQKRFAADTTFSILTIEAGNLKLYAQDETFYLDAPIMGDFSYAFPTGLNLFPKMPDLTSDIDSDWFHAHKADIVNLMREIQMEKTEQTYTDESGEVSEGYRITIPQGCGHFVWELLGMEDPDYDVVCTMYLTDKNHMTKMELDLSHVLEGATMEIEGENLGTLLFTYELPDDEHVALTMVRSSEHSHHIDATVTYDTNVNTQYVMTAAIKWEEEEDGFSLHVNDIRTTKEEELLAEGYFVGEVKKLSACSDVFEGRAEELEQFESLDWKAIRDDADGFVQGILDKMKDTLF